MRRKFELKVENKVECLPRISEFIDQTMKQLKIQKSKISMQFSYRLLKHVQT